INRDLNIIITIYVDDLAIIGPNLDSINNLIKDIQKYFNIKLLGPIKDYLGIEIKRDSNTLKLHQAKYINSVLNKFNMAESKPVYTPMDSKVKLEPNPNIATLEQIKWFQSAIGSLLYLALATRADIAYAVIKLSRFTSNPSIEHITAIKRVFRYLRATIDYGITYSKQNNHYISGFCDSDYAGDISTAKSTSGYVFLLAGGLISWKSKLQSILGQ